VLDYAWSSFVPLAFVRTAIASSVASFMVLASGQVVHVLVPPGSAPATDAVQCYPRTGKDLDLCWAGVDPNGIPVNPVWRAQIDTGGNKVDVTPCDRFLKNPPPCTDWPTDRDVVPLGSPLGIYHYVFERIWHWKPRVHGHVNWGPATYTGRASFEDHQAAKLGLLLDDDYDLALDVASNAGLTLGNANGIALEYKASETIEHFTSPPTYWSRLRATVDTDEPFLGLSFNYRQAKTLLHDRCAIVIGLLGIDTEHDFSTELHPVWGMAVETSAPGADESAWALFARNWGNEGNLSAHQHVLPVNTLKFLFTFESLGDRRRVLSMRLFDHRGRAVTPVAPARTSTGVVLEVPLGSAAPQGARLADVGPLVFGEIVFAR
jgi:hypothetical protein